MTAAALGERFEAAFAVANRLHATQRRKATDIPYISHLLAVCSLVIEDGGDEDMAIAALLHDAAEDQGGSATLDMIAERFGERVAGLVHSLSDTFEHPKPPWLDRKRAYLDHLAEADGDAVRISLADKLHNARSMLADLRLIGPAVWERFKAGPQDMLWYLRGVAGVARKRNIESRSLGQLEATIDQLTTAVDG